MKIQFLVTTVGLNKTEIEKKISSFNIENGFFIVGNQKSIANSLETITVGTNKVLIVNQISIGTSKNRNVILNLSKADFVTFWDDDSYFDHKVDANCLVKSLSPKYNCYRFNTISDNLERPIKQIKKEGKANFFKLKSFGVCGIFFSRDFLLINNLQFNEKIGPGTKVPHGEDSVFLSEVLKAGGKIWQFNDNHIRISQAESCWYYAREEEEYFFSQGYLYYLMFKSFAFLFGIYYVFKNRTLISNNSFFKKIIFFKKGITVAKNETSRNIK